MQDAGHEVLAVCYNYGPGQGIDIAGVNVSRIDINKRYRDKLLPLVHRWPIFNNLWKSELLKRIASFQPDFMLAHDLYMSLPARQAIEASGRSIELVLDLHENFPVAVQGYNWTQGKWKKWLTKPEQWQAVEHKYLAAANKIIVLHTSFKQDLLKKYPDLEGRFHIMPNVSDVTKLDNYGVFRQLVKSTLAHPVMFYFGVVARRRGIFDSLEAFKKVVAQDVDLNYLIIGPVDKSDKETFDRWMQDAAIKHRIQYIPWIGIEDLPSYLDYVDFCIAPFEVNAQHESGVANKIFQYMYGAKAILASNCRPQAEIIRNYDCGVVYEHDEDLVAGMITLATDTEKTVEMGHNGKEALLQHFHVEALKADFLAAFKKSA